MFSFYCLIGYILTLGGGIFVPIVYKQDCRKEVNIGFSEANDCQKICTDNVYNIILMTKGSLVLQIDGHRVKSFAPCVWILKENLRVKFTSSQKLSAQSICFNVAFLYRSVTFETVNTGNYEKLIDKLGLVPLSIFCNHSQAFSYVLPLSDMECVRANNYFANFYSAARNQSYSRWSCQARQNLNGLLEMLHQIYTDFINPDRQNFNKKNPQTWIYTLLKIIHTNYPDGAKLSLVPLSKEIGINKDTVAKKFKEIVGCSVGEYIINYRIKCACHSLVNTEETLKEIASKCGFGSEAYFIRQFKTRKGMSPTQFRKNKLEARQTEVLLSKEDNNFSKSACPLNNK